MSVERLFPHPKPANVSTALTVTSERAKSRTPITCRDCGGRWFRIGEEHCTVCHAHFSSTRAGDKHRVGPHDGDRRCLQTAEMVDLRWDNDKPVFAYEVVDNNIVWRLR